MNSMFIRNSEQYIYVISLSQNVFEQVIILIIIIYIIIKSIYVFIIKPNLGKKNLARVDELFLKIIRPFEFGFIIAGVEAAYLNFTTFCFL